MPYRIVYADEISDHIRSLTARQKATVFEAINNQLTYEPTVETRNRKPLRPNELASWELRVGALRVYYRVHEDPGQQVNVVAIGIKVRNRVLIAGRFYDL